MSVNTTSVVPRVAPSMSEGSIARRLVFLSFPLAFGLAGTMGAQVVTMAYMGSLGVSALAAASFIFPVVTLVLNMGIGMSAGTAAVVGREIGAGSRQRAARLATDAVVLAIAVTGTLGVLGTLAMPTLFRLLGASDELVTLITPYMRVWYAGAPLYVGSMVGLSALRGVGDAAFQGFMLGLAALLSVVFSRILMFGLHGAPQMGFVGAALASVLAWLPMLAATLYRMSRFHLLSVSRPAFRGSSRRLLRIAVPATATNAIIPVSAAIITRIAARFGPIAVAGFGVATRIEGVAMIAFFALSGVMNPFVAQNAGAGEFVRVQTATRLVVRFCLVWGVVLAIGLYGLSPWLLKQLTSDSRVAHIALQYLWIVPLSYGAAGIVMNINAAFNGLDQPGPALWISTARVIGVNLPVAWLGGAMFGAPGIFVGISAANLLVAALGTSWLSTVVHDRVALRHSPT
jgi:putative MATE family efflux protein